jgi:hypothetical protein
MPGTRAQIWISPRHSTYAGFTNTSRHPVSYKNRVYETAENLYHAFKVFKPFTNASLYSYITPLQFIGHNDEVAQMLAKAADPKKAADAFQEFMNPAWQNIYASTVSIPSARIRCIAAYSDSRS